MPLVVPVLRLAYVFLNVFETFKTLRLPPPSARNGGQPSQRAMSARKRAMKGCMTVWLVWVCFIVYERWGEPFVWLFVPFYSEIKSLFILFFILTRAKGAEPVYLHVLRPLIKPYTVPLDALFDAMASFGDLVFLIALIPVNYVRGYYRRWTNALDPPQADVETWHRDETPADVRPPAHRAYASESAGPARPAAKRDAASTGSVKQTRSTIRPSDTTTPKQQIWRPPPSAYDVDDAPSNRLSGLPTPPFDSRPLPNSRPSSIVAPKPLRAGAQFSGVPEEDEQNPLAQQGFRKSLQLPREPRNPGSDGGLSDENQMKGVQHPEGLNIQLNGSDEVDGDGEYDSEEDDDDVFNTTLRTPYARRELYSDDDGEEYLDDLMLTPPPMQTTFSIDSVATRSTALSTTDAGSSLRTRTSSRDSAASGGIPIVFDAVPKRRRQPPRYAADDARFSLDVPASKAGVTGKKGAASIRAGGTIGRTRGKVVAEAQAASALDSPVEDDEDEEEAEVDGEDGGKAETVENGPAPADAGKVGRPAPKRGDSQGTVRAPVTRARGTGPTGTVRGTTARGARGAGSAATVRAPSARAGAGAKKERPPLGTKKSSTSTVGSTGSGERKVPVSKGVQPKAK